MNALRDTVLGNPDTNGLTRLISKYAVTDAMAHLIVLGMTLLLSS
jgi:hypothetical protein